MRRASKSMPLAERLDRLSEPRLEGQCQLWLGSRNGMGYGLIRVRGKTWLAHRLTWECERGPIPEGLCVLHRCDNPACRNVEHLFLGTRAINNADRDAKGRSRGLRGEANRAAKLTEAQAVEILMIPYDVPQEFVGAMYGVTHRVIGLIRRGEAWKHLEV